MRTIPVDSADAREQREAEQARADAARQADNEHATQCRDGWLGEDQQGRPIPCERCRPHLVHVACHTCQVPSASCTAQRAAGRGSCCPHCCHARSRRT